jgi:tetratricopeptide (TPR) repeat protein
MSADAPREAVDRRRLWRAARLAFVAISAATIISLLIFAGIWVKSALSSLFFIQAELALLSLIKIVYAATALLSMPAAALLGILWLRGRSRRQRLPGVARALLLCWSLCLGVALAEAASVVWRECVRGRLPMPVGGLGPAEEAHSAWRLPPNLDHPEPLTEFRDPPRDRIIDIVVMGESSAEGVPFNRWQSIGTIVAWQLEKALAARPTRLTVLARSGDTLERQYQALANLVYRPDLLIVYCGHNEFASRLWWSRNRHYYLDDDQPDWLASLAERAFGLSSVCRLIEEETQQCKIELPPDIDKRQLIDVPVYTEVEHAALLADFRRRLEAIVAYAAKVQAVPVLILPPGNDAGYDPNRSFLRASTPRRERQAFASAFLAARRIEARDPDASIARYRSLLADQPRFAEAHYRLAQLYEQAGRWAEAYDHYVAARDLDGYPTRCLSDFQVVYREVAARHNCVLIDGQSYFHAIGNHGLLDDALFQDAMHPSLRGQIALAQAVLHALKKRRAFGWPAECLAPIIDPDRCVSHFGMKPKDWLALCQWGSGFYTLVTPLRYETSQRGRKRRLYLEAGYRLAAGASAESLGLPNIGIPPVVPLRD